MSMMLRMAGTLGQRLEVDPALVGWWKFDGDLTDASGKGYNGTGVGSPTFTSGIYGQALSLNGTDQRVDLGVGTIQTALEGAPAVTVSAWIYPSLAMGLTALKRFVGIPINGGFVGFEFGVLDKDLRVGGRSASSDGFLSATATNVVTLGKWQHVVGILSFATNRALIYLNGEQILNSSLSFNAENWTNATVDTESRIGMTPAIFVARHWHGELDNFMIYNRALSASEIKYVYDTGRPVLK